MKLRLAAAFHSPHRMGRGIKGEGQAVAWDFQTLLRSNIGGSCGRFPAHFIATPAPLPALSPSDGGVAAAALTSIPPKTAKNQAFIAKQRVPNSIPSRLLCLFVANPNAFFRFTDEHGPARRPHSPAPHSIAKMSRRTSVTSQSQVTPRSLFACQFIDLERRRFSVTDTATKEVMLDNAWMAADGWGRNRKSGKPEGWKGWDVRVLDSWPNGILSWVFRMALRHHHTICFLTLPHTPKLKHQHEIWH